MGLLEIWDQSVGKLKVYDLLQQLTRFMPKTGSRPIQIFGGWCSTRPAAVAKRKELSASKNK
jgi:hypothetical protein